MQAECFKDANQERSAWGPDFWDSSPGTPR